MIVINNVDSQKFTFNGVEYFKNFTPVVVGNKIRVLNTYDSSIELTDAPRLYSDFEVEGVVYGNVINLQTALLPILYTRNSLLGDFLSSDITDYTPATTPLSGTEKALIHDGIDFKEVAVSDVNRIVNAKVFDTSEKVGLKLQNLLDEDFRRVLVIQGGLTANQRRYFEYLNHLGVRTNLMGFNAQNGFIAFDSVNNYHFISCNSGGTSSFNSYGTNQVRINADEGATGTNGMVIFDGTANPSFGANAMYNLSSSGIYTYKGRFLQTQSPDNLQFNKFFCTNGSAYINSTLALRLYNTGNKFNFADSGLVDRFVIDVASSKVKVGIGTAAPNANSIVDVVSTTQFSRPFPVMTEAQRLAIPSPQIGGHVYQSDGTEGVYVYKSSGWVFAY